MWTNFSVKHPWGPILEEPPHFHRFYLQEFQEVLTMKSKEEIPSRFGQGEGNVTILKYAQSVLHDKRLPSRGDYQNLR